MKEVTQGQIDRFKDRAESLGHKWVGGIGLMGLGRRAQLKALRNAMSKTRNEMRRASRRNPWRPR